jgi:PIN domain nuclease of toxin-antitoxin system
MRLLLDTHALLWWLAEDPRLSTAARKAIAHKSNTVMVSAASAWEIATKVRIGRLESAAEFTENLAAYLEQEQFTELPVSVKHGIQAGSLAGTHKDPFDRMLIAQAQAEGLAIVSNELVFDAYGVRRIW